MTKEREALKLALEALEYHTFQTRPVASTEAAIAAIKEALAQPEPDCQATGVCVRSGLYVAQLDQALERNFCSRCGKRLMSALGPVSLHTCCPPNARTFDDYGNKIV